MSKVKAFSHIQYACECGDPMVILGLVGTQTGELALMYFCPKCNEPMVVTFDRIKSEVLRPKPGLPVAVLDESIAQAIEEALSGDNGFASLDVDELIHRNGLQ